MLDLKKKDEAPGNYNDGLFWYFGEEKEPMHIHAVMMTTMGDIESCDIRLTSIEEEDVASNKFKPKEWMDVVFFRFGYFGYQKMNLIDMVEPFAANEWYTVSALNCRWTCWSTGRTSV